MPLNNEELLKPISEDSPAGEDMRYAPLLDQLKEARREEDISRDAFETELKVADWPKVVKLATEILSKKSKDLQVAAWLTEALVYREGFSGLAQGLELIRGLLENFWDTLYPELEDGDSEMRSVPLMFVGTRLDTALRKVPLTATGINWFEYKDSTTVPSEEEAQNDDKKARLRQLAAEDGKLTPEELADSLRQTTSEELTATGDQIKNCRELVDSLDEFCNEKFGDNAPSFAPLKETLDLVGNVVRILAQSKSKGADKKAAAPRRQAPAAAADPFASASPFGDSAAAVGEEAPAEAPSDPFAGAAEPAAAPAQDPFGGGSDPFGGSAVQEAPAARQAYYGGGGVEPSDEDDCKTRLAAAAKWLRSQSPANPASYLLLRGWRWGEIRACGPKPDWLLLVAPRMEVRQSLKRLTIEEKWEELRDACEEAMAEACGRAWLDLQRYALLALQGLGEDYAAAANAIRAELRLFLSEYPALVEMTLDDDTSTASPPTREFLAAEGLSGAAPAPKASEELPPSPDDMIREALKKGRHELALELVAQQMKQESSGRARFQRKIEQARILMGANRTAVAFPILKELAAEVFDRRLEDWEPAGVVVEPLLLYYRCLEAMGAESEEKQKIYATICRLDPVRAFELG
jgi:type VI secretion system protein ImpA